MNTKSISFDIKADFGFLKKYDTNDGIYFTYNCIHKPALLGIFGAITGLKGFYQAYAVKKDAKPEYLLRFESLKTGILPLECKNGSFRKKVIEYNNSVGYANKDGGTMMIKEQTLIKPSYRIYLILNTDNEIEENLYHNIKNSKSCFVPYLGKNEFQLWWENFREYNSAEFVPAKKFSIDTIFKKESLLKNSKAQAGNLLFAGNKNEYMYFERLPFKYSDEIKNYELEEYVHTNFHFTPDCKINNLWKLTCTKTGEEKIVQLN